MRASVRRMAASTAIVSSSPSSSSDSADSESVSSLSRSDSEISDPNFSLTKGRNSEGLCKGSGGGRRTLVEFLALFFVLKCLRVVLVHCYLVEVIAVVRVGQHVQQQDAKMGSDAT